MKKDTATQPSVEIKLAKNIKRSDILFSMATDAQSGHVYCGSSDSNVYELNLDADEPIVNVLSGHKSYVTGVALAGEQLISGGWDRQLIWWDRETDKPLREVRAHDKWIRHVVASPDGTLVASVADDMVCRLWNAEAGRLLQELRGHHERTPHHFPSMLFTCAFSNDGRWLATADKIGNICIWDAKFGAEAVSLESPENYTWDSKQRRHSIGGVRSLCFSPDDRLLAVGGIGMIGNIDHLGGPALVQVYDWREGKRTHKFEHGKQNAIINQLWFHPNGEWLMGAGGANKGVLLFMDLASGEFIHDEITPMHVHAFYVSPDEATIHAVGHHNLAILQVAMNPKAEVG